MRQRLWRSPLVALLLAGSLRFAEGASLTICDGEADAPAWRSKFGRHELVSVERDGVPTRALRLPHDLSKAPRYDWVRILLPEGLDVRPYSFLSFRIRSEGTPVQITGMLMQSVEATGERPHGEITAAAQNRRFDTSFQGWRQCSIPLADYGNLPDIAAAVHQVNFALAPIQDRASGPGVLLFDDLRLTTEPEGTVVQERVAFPPADIAVADERAFFSLLDLDRPELATVRRAAAAEDWQGAKEAWARHLEQRTIPQWTWTRRDRPRIMALHEEQFGGFAGAIAEADRVLQRDFNWLGVRKRLEPDIDWLQGPTEWTHVLSRHGYWRSMGLAWWKTGDAKYAEDWAGMLRDWIADNPVPRLLTNSRGKRGTVWRTLETGIRGDVWCDAMQMFMDAPAFDAQTKYETTRSLVEQARHLHRYTVAFRHGNWQVVECSGLACIGIMLPEFREAAGWRERAFASLAEHMERDVYPDGAHHELTPGYHGWVMERFLKVSLLAQANGYEVSGLMGRHERMFEFLMHVSQPNRRTPSLGDAGSGVGIAGNMGLGALLYGRPDMRYLAADRIQPSWIWLFPAGRLAAYADLPARQPTLRSHMMPHAQYGMMRTGWGRDDRSLLFDCAPWGGGHSHQDRLQVILHAGRDLLVDPGMYSYDQPLSTQYFRKAEAHNVLTIDDGGQPQSDPEVLSWTVSGEAEFGSGIVRGDGVTHQRSVLFVKPDYWVVVDHAEGEGERALTRFFHFPQVEVTADGGAARTRFVDGQNVWIANADGARLEIREGWLPTGGATATKAPVAAFVGKETLPAVLCTVLVPFATERGIPAVERVAAADSRTAALRVSFPDGRTDWIAVAPQTAPLQAAGHAGIGVALCVRAGAADRKVALLQAEPLRSMP